MSIVGEEGRGGSESNGRVGGCFPDCDKEFAYNYVRVGETVGRMIWAATLEEITEADEKHGWRVAYIEEGFYAREAENGNRIAWRVRGRVRRRLWSAEHRRKEAKYKENP